MPESISLITLPYSLVISRITLLRGISAIFIFLISICQYNYPIIKCIHFGLNWYHSNSLINKSSCLKKIFNLNSTSIQIKMRSKSANISGLQLADIFAHPVKMWVLNHYGLIDSNQSLFAEKLLDIGKEKFNSQLYTKKIQGYGYVLYPQKKRVSCETLLRSPLRAIHLRLAD
jgi:hypothetical protein